MGGVKKDQNHDYVIFERSLTENIVNFFLLSKEVHQILTNCGLPNGGSHKMAVRILLSFIFKWLSNTSGILHLGYFMIGLSMISRLFLPVSTYRVVQLTIRLSEFKAVLAGIGKFVGRKNKCSVPLEPKHQA